MRIDLNHITLQDLAREEKTWKTGLKDQISASVEDKTSLSADTKSIASLQAQALATPAIRQDKVDALRQAIQQGDYRLEPDQIAHAILSQNQR